jgi:hypothetical protein
MSRAPEADCAFGACVLDDVDDFQFERLDEKQNRLTL